MKLQSARLLLDHVQVDPADVPGLVLERAAKQLVQRQWPGTTVPDAILRGVPHRGLSCTCGHVIVTFAIAGLLVLVLLRRWEPATGLPAAPR